MSGERPGHEGIGHDGEKYRIDNVAFDAIENIRQVDTLLSLVQRRFLHRGGMNHHPVPMPRHLAIDFRKVNMDSLPQNICALTDPERASLAGRQFPTEVMPLPPGGGSVGVAAIAQPYPPGGGPVCRPHATAPYSQGHRHPGRGLAKCTHLPAGVGLSMLADR